MVYADPPYTRDHYSRFYHVLETISLWDDPGVSTTRIRAKTTTFSRGVYRADRHQSPFCIKSQAPGAFERLFSAVRDLQAPLVLSYSPYAIDSNAHPRVMTVEQITSLAAKYFTRVETISPGRISHMKLNTTRLNIDAATEAELIFLLMVPMSDSGLVLVTGGAGFIGSTWSRPFSARAGACASSMTSRPATART